MFSSRIKLFTIKESDPKPGPHQFEFEHQTDPRHTQLQRGPAPEAVGPDGGGRERGLVVGGQLPHQPNIRHRGLQVGPTQQVVQPNIRAIGQLPAQHGPQLQQLPGAAAAATVLRVDLTEGGEEGDDGLREVLAGHLFSKKVFK